VPLFCNTGDIIDIETRPNEYRRRVFYCSARAAHWGAPGLAAPLRLPLQGLRVCYCSRSSSRMSGMGMMVMPSSASSTHS
jgi:hypothetical protein